MVAFAALGADTLWECVDADDGFPGCPGRFHFTCPEEPILLADEECECPGQRLVRMWAGFKNTNYQSKKCFS